MIIRISKTVERLRRKASRACKMVASCIVLVLGIQSPQWVALNVFLYVCEVECL